MKLYLKFIGMHLRSAMEYKVSFFLMVIGQVLGSMALFASLWFVCQRFETVGGFTYGQVLICFAVVLMAFTLAEAFFRGFDLFASMIGNGEFDRILVRPRNEIFLVLCSKLELTRIGRLLQAIAMLAYAIPNCGISWTPVRIAVLCYMILGGTMTFAGLFLIYDSLCFFTLEGLEFMNIFTDGAREHGKYPFSVYGKPVLIFVTAVIPLACFQYWPLTWLIGQTTNPLAALAPTWSILFLIPCFLLWKLGVRHYKSTGS